MTEESKPVEQAVRKQTPHDEAFKKLLQTFFADFISLFFPELDALLDHSNAKLLMQELLVDIVGKEGRDLDLLLETKYKTLNAFILIHLEPQSYKEDDFHERMFIYFARLFELYRKKYPVIIPIAIFSADEASDEPNTLRVAVQDKEILKFQFLKVELKQLDWRRFIDSDNPVAAALLAKMGYNKREVREVRTAYLRMMLRLRSKLDDARMALMMSVADLYFQPNSKMDEEILGEIKAEYLQKGVVVMELMPAWMRMGYEKGIAEGVEEGKKEGREEGREEERREVVRKLLGKGFSHEQLADTLDISVEEVKKLAN